MLAEHTVGYRNLAKRFEGVDYQALYRHEREHLQTSLQQVQKEKGMTIAEFLLRDMQDTQALTKKAMEHSLDSADERGVFIGAEVRGRNWERLARWVKPNLEQAEHERWAAEQTEQFRKRLDALHLPEPTPEQLAEDEAELQRLEAEDSRTSEEIEVEWDEFFKLGRTENG